METQSKQPCYFGASDDRLLHTADGAMVAYAAAVALAIAVVQRSSDQALELAYLHVAAAVVVLLVASFARRNRLVDLIRHWLPGAFIPAAYFAIAPLVAVFHPHLGHADAILQQADVWVFGNPTAWFAASRGAVITDVMALCYVSFYFLPLVAALWAWRKGGATLQRTISGPITLAFLVTYCFYLMFPALGPNRTGEIIDLSQHAVASSVLAPLLSVEGMTPDVFPSGHTLITVVLLLQARRVSRGLFLSLLPISIGLIAATLSLRFHYLADVLVSFAMAPAVVQLTGQLDSWLQQVGDLVPGISQKMLTSAHERRSTQS